MIKTDPAMTRSQIQTLTLTIAQINPTVGDIEGNLAALRTARDKARGGAESGTGSGAGSPHVVVGGELAVAGYPPEDLVLKTAFQDRVEAGIHALAVETADGGPALLVGAPWRDTESSDRRQLRNAALLLGNGRLKAAGFKHDLPNYGVFDEKRVFAPGPLPSPMTITGDPPGVRLGVMICEDMWTPGPAAALKEKGAAILVVLNGSPFEAGKTGERLALARARVAETGLPLVYVNLVGGQDELVFDGASFILDGRGELRLRAPSWEEAVIPTIWRLKDGAWAPDPGSVAEPLEPLETVWRALVTGLRDYVNKNHFPGVLIGLSGGIDSALSAAVAVDALGAGRVHCVMMPSPYTSKESLEDAAEAARLMGVRLDTIPIDAAMNAFDAMLKEAFVRHPVDTTEENIQARARGVILMALSNKFGHMVLSTGNKSEMSVGYATLYGDMCGGYSVLKDVYKTMVFELSHWRNRRGRVIPERTITKPPSAELRPNQTDQDSLPPYDQLDAILRCLIEKEMSLGEIAGEGHDPETVQRVWRMLDRAEYKRRQAPPGVKITRRAFGRDRRYPITNGFTGHI